MSRDTASTEAVSSMLNPPKKRSSTTRLFRWSNFARASSASSSATTSSPGSPVTDERLVEAHLDGSAAAFLRAACPRVVHENAPHHPRRHRKKMPAVLPRDSVCIDQPDIRLVHQRRRLEAVAGTFPRHAAPRDSIKLLMDERNQSLQGGLVALRPSEKERRNFGWIVRDAAILSVLASFPSRFPLS